MHPKLTLPRVLYSLFAGGMLLCQTASLSAQGLDAEMTTLAENLAKQIKESGLKKISVVDFSDLQGNYNELGRFIAEHLTVNMVTHRKEFSMVDRANLKRLLEEHKLSMSGLVDPANAKKLGQISGLDAIIIGNVTPLKTDVSITAKIIATETAEIVGAGRSSVRRGEEIDQLLDRGIAGGGGGSGSDNSSGSSGPPKKEFSAAMTTQKFHDFEVQLLSFKILPNGVGFAALQINNTSKSNTVAVAGNSIWDNYKSKLRFSGKILDDKGNFVRCIKSDGVAIGIAQDREHDRSDFLVIHQDIFNYSNYNNSNDSKRAYAWVAKMAEIHPSDSLRFTLEFAPEPKSDQNQNEEEKIKFGTVFKLQAELITIQVKEGDKKPKPKLDNIYFDNITVTPATTQPK